MNRAAPLHRHCQQRYCLHDIRTLVACCTECVNTHQAVAAAVREVLAVEEEAPAEDRAPMDGGDGVKKLAVERRPLLASL